MRDDGPRLDPRDPVPRPVAVPPGKLTPRAGEHMGAEDVNDPGENFFLENGKLMLRSQTSTVQIRTMQKTPPPLKIIAMGRVYRPDTHDATHYSMFHQVEGLSIDRNVTMVDLKTTLFQFARAYFGPGAEVRIRPHWRSALRRWRRWSHGGGVSMSRHRGCGPVAAP